MGCLLIVGCDPSVNDASSEAEPGEKNDFITYDSAAVVTAHPISTQIGYDILKNGGNAYDAAIAIQFVLTACYPRAGNIGGGGFMLSRNSNGAVESLDFREKAPKAATKNMYLDDQGNVIEDLSKKGIKSSGVPGSVAGMWAIHKKYGSMSWKELVQPAIQLAIGGSMQTPKNIKYLNDYRQEIIDANEGYNEYAPEVALKVGDKLKNFNLYNTLVSISKNGKNGFYRGTVAELIVEQNKKLKGLITRNDLINYKAIWREAIHGDVGAYSIYSMGPPSSGGIAIVQLLEGSALLNIDKYPHNSPEAIHLMTELKKRVYADRATWLGDSDFFDVPDDSLLSDIYLRDRFSNITIDAITPSADVKSGSVERIESHETTHYSIVDQYGNAVSITTTLNSNFGSKIIVEGAGFFLNNEMDDFSIKPGLPNQFGLVGGTANAIEPEKRMLSSMSPTIVEKNGKLWMILGSPGGSTIITNVYQCIQNVKDYGMCMQEAVNAGKVHSQWLPEIIHYEEGKIDKETLRTLQSNGYILEPWDRIGLMEAILIHEDGKIEAAADSTRGEDSAMGW